MPSGDKSNRDEAIPTLIIGYKRVTNIIKIVELCLQAGVRDIYIYLDGQKNSKPSSSEISGELISSLQPYLNQKSVEFHLSLQPTNQGAAVSVIRAIDWAMKSVDQLLILEDDCIPSLDFFLFCKEMIDLLGSSSSIWCASGSQFVPESMTKGRAYISRYSLTWGWCTTRKKWEELRKALETELEHISITSLLTTNPQEAFWASGTRRALKGYTDVWDTIMVYLMQKNKKFSILPGNSLVTNIGDDEAATHTGLDSRWTHSKIGSYKPQESLDQNEKADSWLKSHFYEIRLRHLFSTKIRFFMDMFSPTKFDKPLLNRLRD